MLEQQNTHLILEVHCSLRCLYIYEASQGGLLCHMFHPFVHWCWVTSGSKCRCGFSAWRHMLLFLEFIQWKNTQVCDIYRVLKRIQFLNRQNNEKCSNIDLFLVFYSVAFEFWGEFALLVADKKFCGFQGNFSWRFLSLGRPHLCVLHPQVFTFCVAKTALWKFHIKKLSELLFMWSLQKQ